jgi:hypothetical protein
MSCYNQSGVRRIVLYENIDISITYDPVTEGAVGIATGGSTITITSDLRPDYTNVANPGANYGVLNNVSIKWYNFDIVEGRTLIDQLRNYFGWYAVVTFNDGESYIIETPLFLNQSSTMVSSNTHTWEISIQSEVDSDFSINTFEAGALGGIGYMQLENDFIVS